MIVEGQEIPIMRHQWIEVSCMLKARHGIAYSHTLICHSVFILSLGYTEKRSKEWKQGIVRAIGFTSESLRFPLMKDVIKRTSDLNAYATETPSAEIFQMMNNWDKISRSVRSGRPFKLGTRTYLHCCLCKIVSLLNHNDGTELKKAENSLNKCAPVSCNNGTEKEDLENSLNKGFLVPHDRICPSFLSRVSGSISDMSGVLLKPNTNIYSHGMSSMVFSQLTHNDGFEMENSLNGKGFLVPHHRISPKRANDNNFLSRVPSSICDISCISLKPVTNIYSHGMSSLVLSPLTRIDGFEMENSLNGMVSLERSICLTGAIAGTKEPQHSNFPRRANDSNVLSRVLSFISNGRGKPSKLISNIDSHGISRAAFSPLTHNYGTEMENSWNRMGSLVPQNDICPRGAIGGSLVPQHIICPRRANAVVHYTPPCFPARAYRCPRPLFSNFLISASRMMIFFMHHR